MKKVSFSLLIALLLAGVSCSRSEKDNTPATPTPDATLQSRMQQQQKAIQRAAEERRKEQERNAGQSTPSPSPG